MKSDLLKHIINKFKIHSEFESYQELDYGHINDTYLIKTQNEPHYILQKINSNVFPQAQELIRNKVLVSNYLQQKYSHLKEEEIYRKVLCFVEAKDTTFFYKDSIGNYWNTSVYIDDSVTYEKAPNIQVAFEAGKATGKFLEVTKNFDASQLHEILPKFHSITFRYQQFKTAVKNTTVDKLNFANELIDFVEKHIVEMQQIDKAIEANQIPLRLTHSDTKISNILFSKDNKAMCLIDTDTVMQGVIHYDYGDAIRTICNTADEDSNNENEIDFNHAFFKSYSEGFFNEIKELTKKEINLLPLSIKMMPFIMGVRFLTDYLNNNIYYKTNYENHNFDRAINQFTLVKRINHTYSEIKAFLDVKLQN